MSASACFIHSNLFSFVLFLTTTSFLTFLLQQPPQRQLNDDSDAAGWVMPHKKCWHPCLCRFMEFLCGFSVEFDNRATFTRAELLLIRPSDIERWLGLAAHGDPDCDVSDPVSHRPACCRPSNLEAIKRALSCCMPHRHAPWCNDQGNPTRSAPVNDLIKEVKKFEVRGEGQPSQAKRAVRPNEFAKALSLLRSQPGFDCKHKCSMACLWQHQLIGRLDDTAHFEAKDPQGHPNFDFALRTNVRWSKNVMEERQCPPQASSCMSLLHLSLVVLMSI